MRECTVTESTFSNVTVATDIGGLGTVTITVVLTPISDNGDGTWLYEVTTLWATSTQGTVTSVELPGGQVEDDQYSLDYCINVSPGAVFVNNAHIQLVDPMEATVPGFEYWGLELVDAELNYADIAAYDNPPVCISTVTTATAVTGAYSFRLFEMRGIAYGLTVGACYSMTMTLEWSQDNETWTSLTDVVVDFEATAVTETSEWSGTYPTSDPPRSSLPWWVRIAGCRIVEVTCP